VRWLQQVRHRSADENLAGHHLRALDVEPTQLLADEVECPLVGLFGRGWTTMYDETMTTLPGDLLQLTLPDGRVMTTLSPDFHGQMVRNEDGSYAVTFKDGGVHRFNASGKLLSLTDRRGNQTLLTYINGRLSSITDPFARALTVTTSVPTIGSWAWLDNKTVHWRPESYYAPGTAVTVKANLYGVAVAPGVYGKADVSVNFTIGRSQVVQANTQTHRMVVVTNGVQTSDFPASFGLDSDLGRNTHSGTHVVMGRSQTVFMTSVKYHYTNLEVHWAVRISNNGEYIHAAPWSVGAQGRTNVSHGCVNLSDANAIAYYNNVLVGDPVEITGSALQLGPADGDFYDWTLTWAQWQAKSALAA